ncbi:Ku domain-containing protein [Advenella kashmirensis W13003]|uniref:Non-homologous end joining protein Ku n=1 Tax=Advenella kashmirensis W13003 TaxID=1424334 RepID=V8QWL6_9BURK|nr:Ku protein [Advenella kashmirensis]ETF03700.1 Ku domain-containing protein [Advenella kashmirensis W13003]
MARPIWNGTLSFGLLNIPVALMPGERRTDLHFRMLDSRDNTPIRYERVNADTGDEVPWKDIIKAFEYSKGNYVVLEPDDISDAAPKSKESVDVEAFVDAGAIAPAYFEKPYVLVPGKKAEKGYVLLRETLSDSGKIGIARVVIRTREYLCAVMPQGSALMLILLRYPQELVDVDDYRIPEGKLADYRISKQEMTMAGQLISSMAADWKPADYKDEFRQRLSDVIKKRMKANKVASHETEEDEAPVENATTNVVDFMSLLKESLATNKRTPAKGGSVSGKKPDSKTTASTAGKSAKKAPAKKTPAKKTAKTAKKTTRTASQTRSAAKTAGKKSASSASRSRKNADNKKKAA